MNDKINELLKNEEISIVALRRNFHKYAESGWLEFRTASIIAQILNELGYEITMCNDILNSENIMGYPAEDIIEKAKNRAILQGGNSFYIDKMSRYTGLIATLDTKKKGKNIALRFDIDANDIDEAKSDNHLPYELKFASVNEGMAHCCGHDGHMAIGITCAKILSQLKNELTGKITFIFQPAEEGVRGAKAICQSGLIDNIDYFLSGHIGFKALSSNKTIAGANGFLATKKINVKFKGKSAHAGASPEKGNNALLAAAFATISMHTMCQDGRGMSRVNVGKISGGTSSNVVAENAEISMEVRGENCEICDNLYDKCVIAIESSAKMFGVCADIKLCGEAPSCESNEELAKLTAKVIKALYPNENIETGSYFGASEDAAFYINKVNENGGKGEYILFGTEIKAPHHNSFFDFNENVLIKATNILVNTVIELQNK